MTIINFISENDEVFEIPCKIVQDSQFHLYQVKKESLQKLISNDKKIVKRTLADNNQVWYRKDDENYVYYY